VDRAPGESACVDASGLFDEAGNLSGVGTESIDNVKPDAGVTVCALYLSEAEYALVGSAVVQSFAVLVGQALSYDWQISTLETAFEDYAFVALGSVVATLASRSAPGAGSVSTGLRTRAC
jgi:hypothetical protein